MSKDDLLIETVQRNGLVSQTEKDVTVVLDTNLTDSLIEEGFVREIISKIQTMRKEAGYEVQDHIEIFCEGNEKIDSIILNNSNEIMSDTLGESVSKGVKGYSKEWSINGEKVTLSVNKL